jgi:hypothetical protein
MNRELKSILFFVKLLSLLLLAACTSGGTAGEPTAVPATPMIDEATGLELNPVVMPEGEFMVQGTITAVTLIPQDEPLIKIMTDNGQLYQIRSQPVPQITYEDGTVVPPLEIKNGQQIRATVVQGEAGGLGGDPVLVSSNLTILDTD